jgi:acetoin:2,6-dichlorophenolindophenol oxidoreductase subunit alpha
VLRRVASDAREGKGPQLVVATLLRLCGHGEHDDASYVDPMLRQGPVGRDCLKVAEEFLSQKGWANKQDVDGWRAEFMRSTDDLVSKVQREGAPNPSHEDWTAISTDRLREMHNRA